MFTDMFTQKLRLTILNRKLYNKLFLNCCIQSTLLQIDFIKVNLQNFMFCLFCNRQLLKCTVFSFSVFQNKFFTVNNVFFAF